MNRISVEQVENYRKDHGDYCYIHHSVIRNSDKKEDMACHAQCERKLYRKGFFDKRSNNCSAADPDEAPYNPFFVIIERDHFRNKEEGQEKSRGEPCAQNYERPNIPGRS